MTNKILNYYSEDDMSKFLGLKNGDMYTEQVGNTFYILKKTKEKRFFRTIDKTETVLYIVMCCGVHEQTLVDILKSYGFDMSDFEE